MRRRFICPVLITALMVAAATPLTAARATAQTIYNPVADYDAGFAAGSNPNGVWTYGWSSTLTSTSNVFPRHRTIAPNCAPSPETAWDDPSGG